MADGERTGLRARVPVPLSWLAGYQSSWLSGDVIGGLATAAVVIPQAIAYGSLAGLPVQLGLYTALVPMILYAVLGGSRALSVSTTSTIAILTATAIADLQPDDPAATAAGLALLVGAVLIGAGIARAGFLADFISLPVLTGFKVGTGVTILASQLGKVLGVDVEGEGPLRKLWSAISQLGEASVATVAVAAACLLVLVALKRLAPRVPGPLVVTAVAIAVSALADLGEHGVALVGEVAGGLPGPTWPAVSAAMLPAALGIALISFVESTAAARAFTKPGDPRLDGDRELLALGTANLAGGLFRAFPSGGGLSQTAVNDSNGARTPLAGLVTAGTVGIVLAALTGVLADLPEATLGAVVLMAAAGLVDTTNIRHLLTVSRRDGLLGVTAAVAVAVLGVLDGIAVTVVLSLLALLHEANLARVRHVGPVPGGGWGDVEDQGRAVPGLLVVHPEARALLRQHPAGAVPGARPGGPARPRGRGRRRRERALDRDHRAGHACRAHARARGRRSGGLVRLVVARRGRHGAAGRDPPRRRAHAPDRRPRPPGVPGAPNRLSLRPGPAAPPARPRRSGT